MIPPVVRGQTQRMMDCHFKILDIHFGWKKPHFIPIYKGFLLKMGAGYYLFRVSFHNFHFFIFHSWRRGYLVSLLLCIKQLICNILIRLL